VRQITYLCNRCGAAILENRSTLEVKAGTLGSHHDEPIDLHSDCVQRFEEWLKPPRENSTARLTAERAAG
jgi:hypothetical protein